jgi:hypothetical protein
MLLTAVSVIKRNYGGAELKIFYPKYLMRGLRYSLALQVLLLGIYWGVDSLQPEEIKERQIRLVKYEELGGPPSISGIQFGLSAYPVLPQQIYPPNQKTAFAQARLSIPPSQRSQKPGPRGMNAGLGDLPTAPGYGKLSNEKLLADNGDPDELRSSDVDHAVGGGKGESDDKFRGGTPIAAKRGDVPSGSARSGIGSNPYGISAGEGGGSGDGSDGYGVGSQGYQMSWLKGGTRRKLSGDLPKYPPGVNVEAPISILAVVAPDGSIKSVQPRQKGNTQLENAAMKELRYWKFEPLSSSASQIDQSCVVTFLFKLK